MAAIYLLTNTAQGFYYKTVEEFSFDAFLGEYPLSYVTFGSSISTKSNLKLLPPVNQSYGALFLNQVCIIASDSNWNFKILSLFLYSYRSNYSIAN